MANLFEIIENIHGYNLNLSDRSIYLFGEESYTSGTGIDETQQPGVEYIMANKFVKNLNILSSISKKPITIHSSTNGGHWCEGIMIYDAIKSCKSIIKIINYKEARSMSSIIFLAADERIMMPNSQFMIHTGTTTIDGTGTQVDTEYKEHKKAMDIMLQIYTNHLYKKPYWKNKTKQQITNWIKKQMKASEEVYFTAEEALELGFCDSIMNIYEVTHG
jgi:ATP-dependent protease ClpP protease subunit